MIYTFKSLLTLSHLCFLFFIPAINVIFGYSSEKVLATHLVFSLYIIPVGFEVTIETYRREFVLFWLTVHVLINIVTEKFCSMPHLSYLSIFLLRKSLKVIQERFVLTCRFVLLIMLFTVKNLCMKVARKTGIRKILPIYHNM